MKIPRAFLLVAASAALALSLAACSKSEGSAGSGPPPPAPVSFIAVTPQAIPVVSDLPGRIAPTQIAEVRPRVSGIVIKRVFQQGSTVKEGDILYRIDPAPFRVQVESAEATLEKAQAGQQLANQLADRQKQLAQRDITSQQDLDSAIGQLAQANADVAVARAGLDAADLNLQYADVKAPIAGRIGRAMITEGALVTAGGADPLATIQQLDPVYADFTQSSHDFMALRQAVKDGRVESPAPGQATVTLAFDDGAKYKYPGRLLFSESTVDETTGQITMRAEFPNPDGDLLPGMYVRVELQQGVQQAALTIPEQAILRDAGGKAQVYAVDGDSKVQLRTVGLGETVGANTIVTSGLASGDHVVMEGFQKIRPGDTVAPQEWKPAAARAPGTAGSAGPS